MEVKLSDRVYNICNSLIFKYLDCTFESPVQETEFIGHLRNLLNEPEEELEFEAKIAIIKSLISGIQLKKFDTILFTNSQNK